MEFGINPVLVECFPAAFNKLVKRNHANMCRLSLWAELDRAAGGLVGELRSGHDNGLVSGQVAIPVLKILDVLFSQPRKDGFEFAECVRGMADVIAQSFNDGEKQENGRIPERPPLVLRVLIHCPAIARYSSMTSMDMDRRSL